MPQVAADEGFPVWKKDSAVSRRRRAGLRGGHPARKSLICGFSAGLHMIRCKLTAHSKIPGVLPRFHRVIHRVFRIRVEKLYKGLTDKNLGRRAARDLA